MIKDDGIERQIFIVPEHYPQMSLADCLRRLGISLNLRRKIKHYGVVRIDGVICPWHAKVSPKSEIQMEWTIASQITPEDIPLAIIYEDDWLLVVDKPAGMLVHPTSSQPGGTLANAVIYYYRQQRYSHSFHPVQRLDRNTSGLLAIAKLSSIHHLMNKQRLRRQYLAIATGTPHVTEGSIDLPIARHPDSIIIRIVSSNGQDAVTHYRVLQSFPTASLLQLELETGRTHQIRLHLSHIGHPLLGDDLYGGKTDLIARQALHSYFLELHHPITGSVISLSSPLPQDLEQLLKQLESHTAAGASHREKNNSINQEESICR
jgi:23S rRNA pseudouridine1911/1915/1917 synthase